VQRPDLNDSQKVQALSALGEDYMRSGLLDRAETVFGDLAQLDQRAPQALRHLIGIYQAERDWEKAIENATRFEAATGEAMGKLVGQFECELPTASARPEHDAARASIARATGRFHLVRRHQRRPDRRPATRRRGRRSSAPATTEYSGDPAGPAGSYGRSASTGARPSAEMSEHYRGFRRCWR
jgi:hypothetical protein